jgi:hypothetical protein
VPQLQAPAEEQLSARSGVQAVHMPPLDPHATSDTGVVQLAPWQQPLGHDVASHVQTPAAQCWPGPHAAPTPHLQTPSETQVSDWIVLHLTQVAPLAPHASDERALHAVPAQQLLGHDVASHTQSPPTHSWPGAHAALPPHSHLPVTEQAFALDESHAAHALPPMPHVESDDAWHCDPAQQPSGHEASSQTHAPPTHRCPVPHDGLHAGPVWL